MANENVKFKRGEKADLPLKGENGSIYVTTDTGEMYMDTQTTANNASNGESVSGRIKIKDTTKAPINHASTGTSYGVSSESNYGHAKASTTTPKANGTASAGSETSSFARGDHVHPLQTSVANATKATQDSAGQQINTTYIKGLSVNGRTITYTKGDGTTGTITTQDSNTTYGVATSSTLGLVKSGGDITVDGTGTMSVANDSHTHSNSTITSLDASKLTGTINIDRLPKGSLERLVPVEDEDARFALTTNDVQLGDTVQQLDTGVMYLVVNESELDNENGYKEYTAGSATSVPWSGITGKPSSFTPSSHTHTISQITNISSANVASAVKATQDSAGQDIDSTYIKGLSVSGRTITYTKGDGTTGTITTQDTNTTYSNATTSTAGLMSSSDKSKLDGIESGANKYTHPSYTAKSSGLYKVTVDGTGHVSATSAVTKSDITALGIPGQDTNTTYSAFNGATSSAAGGSGLVPAPSAGASNRYLRSDGTWAVPPDTNTTYTLSSFGITATAAELNKLDGVTATATEINYLDGVTSSIQTQLNSKASSSHSHSNASTSAAGFLRQLSGSTTQYLRGDGTWATPPDTNTTYSTFKGATTSAAGSTGLVPAPTSGSATRYLRSDGTWQVPPDTNTTYTGSDGISVSGTTISHSNSITAGNAGPTANSSPSFGGSFTVPYIVYDARGHITSRTNRSITLPTPLTSLSSATSNTSVLGAKIVADSLDELNSSLVTINTPHGYSGTYNFSTGTTDVSTKNSNFSYPYQSAYIAIANVTIPSSHTNDIDVMLAWGSGTTIIDVTRSQQRVEKNVAASLQSVYIGGTPSSTNTGSTNPILYLSGAVNSVVVRIQCFTICTGSSFGLL